MSTSIAKILIVDDHPMVREGLAGRIVSEPDLEVCGEAVDVDDALQQTKELLPDLIIVDISLKTSHGIDLIKQLKSSGRGAHLKVLVHTMYTESLYADAPYRLVPTATSRNKKHRSRLF